MRGGTKGKQSKGRKKNNKRKSSLENNVVSVNGKDYDIVDVKGDGNCLFRCFSYYLYKNEDSHFDIRQTCVNYTVEHWTEEAPILFNTCEGDEEEAYVDAESYRHNMGSNSCMGTDYELGVFIRNLNIPATYFREYETDEPTSIRQVQVLDNDNVNTNARRLNILFTGRRRNGHWQILLDKSDANEEHNEQELLAAANWLNSGKTTARKKKSQPKSGKKSRRTNNKAQASKLEVERLDDKSESVQLPTINIGYNNPQCCCCANQTQRIPTETRFEEASANQQYVYGNVIEEASANQQYVYRNKKKSRRTNKKARASKLEVERLDDKSESVQLPTIKIQSNNPRCCCCCCCCCANRTQRIPTGTRIEEASANQQYVYGNVIEEASANQPYVYGNVIEEANSNQQYVYGNVTEEISANQQSVYENVTEEASENQQPVYENVVEGRLDLLEFAWGSEPFNFDEVNL